MTGLRRLGSEGRVGSEMGRKGVYPLFFLKSADVAWNQRVVEIWKMGVCRRLKRRDLREGVKDVERGAIRIGGVSSRTSIACGRVLVNDDLLHGNSNAAPGGSNGLGGLID